MKVDNHMRRSGNGHTQRPGNSMYVVVKIARSAVVALHPEGVRLDHVGCCHAGTLWAGPSRDGLDD
jgi:hypothetical protein